MPVVVPSQLTVQPRRDHLARDGQARDHVATRAGSDDDEVPAHARPPRISCRLSMSILITIASAIMFITMAEPP